MIKENDLILLHNKLFNMTDVIIKALALPYHRIGVIAFPICGILLLFSIVFIDTDSNIEFVAYLLGIFAPVSLTSKYMYDYIFQSEDEYYKSYTTAEMDLFKIKKLKNFIENKKIIHFSNIKFLESLFFAVFCSFILSALFILPGLVLELVQGHEYTKDFSFGFFHFIHLILVSGACFYFFKKNINSFKTIEKDYNNLNKDFSEVDKTIETLLLDIEGDLIFKLYILKNEAKKFKCLYLENYLDIEIKNKLKEFEYSDIEDYFIRQRNQNMSKNNNVVIIENS